MTSSFKSLLLTIVLLFVWITTFANNDNSKHNPTQVKQILASQCSPAISQCKEIKLFYRKHDYQPLWFNGDELSKNAKALIEVIENSYNDGLSPDKYHLAEINQLLAMTQNSSFSESMIISESLNLTVVHALNHDTADNESVSLPTMPKPLAKAALDVTLTKAFFAYSHDLYNGTIDNKKVFPYWKNEKSQVNSAVLLNNILKNGRLNEKLANLTPTYPGYAKLKKKLATYRKIAIDNPWETISDGDDLKLGDSGSRVKSLQQHLQITGELLKRDTDYGQFDVNTENALIQYQEDMGLLDNGVVDQDTLKALNIPVTTRIRQLELGLDLMRMLPSNMADEYVMVNIPDYTLKLVKNNKEIIIMDVAVGSYKHQSCVLSSKINYLVANPAWYVPQSIAESELFPILQTGIGYLTSHNIEVTKANASGTSTTIDPSKVNWKQLTLRQFRSYQFRQKPGANNVLGKVKFIFNNPCQIYIHDSIEPDVFDASERDLSHGCIRMAKPMLLSKYVLGNDASWSKEQIDDLFKTARNKAVTLDHPITLYIVYLNAWVNHDGYVQFRDDIYKLLNLANYSDKIYNIDDDSSDNATIKSSESAITTKDDQKEESDNNHTI